MSCLLDDHQADKHLGRLVQYLCLAHASQQPIRQSPGDDESYLRGRESPAASVSTHGAFPPLRRLAKAEPRDTDISCLLQNAVICGLIDRRSDALESERWIGERRRRLDGRMGKMVPVRTSAVCTDCHLYASRHVRRPNPFPLRLRPSPIWRRLLPKPYQIP